MFDCDLSRNIDNLNEVINYHIKLLKIPSDVEDIPKRYLINSISIYKDRRQKILLKTVFKLEFK